MPKATTIHGRQYGTGKRKNAVARVFVKPGSGVIKINGRTNADYFPRETLQMIVAQPFEVIGKPGEFDVEANVHGGGVAAQAQAVRHGISRALLHVEGDTRGGLKKAGLLTRDSRKKERKKPGQPGARKKFQYSKR
ncbi:MAG: 30S ribosomal protein S9 [Myxococcota bacterium]